MVEEGLTMEWFYDIVEFMWRDNMYTTIFIITFIIGYIGADVFK